MSVATRIETPGETAYRQIRADILFGRLLPSQKLKLDGLREHYGTSVSTLREILSRLSSEGLIVAEGQRGFEVAPISAKNLKEIASLRQLLEAHALEQRYRGVEKLRLAISPSAHFSMRIASLDADPRGRL